MNAYGSSLPAISSHRPTASRSAARACQLPSRDNRHRRQIGRDDEEQKGHDARNHEVAALEPRIEPDADLEPMPRRTAPASRWPPSVPASNHDQRARVAHRHVVELESVPSATICTVAGVRSPRPAVLRRDTERHPRVAAIELRSIWLVDRYEADDLEIGRRLEARDQLAACGASDRRRR